MSGCGEAFLQSFRVWKGAVRMKENKGLRPRHVDHLRSLFLWLLGFLGCWGIG
jgi:hypothetical protein